MVFALTNPLEGALKLTQSVIQITEMLGMYRAELARVLHIRCEDIGRLIDDRKNLEPDTESWEQAILFVRLYEILYEYCEGNGVAMCHWLRTNNQKLAGEPLLLIVDDNKLQQVFSFLEKEVEKNERFVINR
jgi:hypothetical protein